ncbi:MAG: hypothetical protein AAF849_03630, partial [Bacteroidota bacterium]
FKKPWFVWKDSTCPPHRVRLRREADVLLNENKRNLIVGDIFLKILDRMKSFRASLGDIISVRKFSNSKEISTTFLLWMNLSNAFSKLSKNRLQPNVQIYFTNLSHFFAVPMPKQ